MLLGDEGLLGKPREHRAVLQEERGKPHRHDHARNLYNGPARHPLVRHDKRAGREKSNGVRILMLCRRTSQGRLKSPYLSQLGTSREYLSIQSTLPTPLGSGEIS